MAEIMQCDTCDRAFDATDKRALVHDGRGTCPLCSALRFGYASWGYRNDCQGLFGEAFDFKPEAEAALAKSRGDDASPDWKVVPVVILEIPAGSVAAWRAHKEAAERQNQEAR